MQQYLQELPPQPNTRLLRRLNTLLFQALQEAEHKAGALKFIKPAGQTWHMITCDEMDRWLADSVS